MFSIMYGQLSPIKLDVDVEPKDPWNPLTSE
jgi:hypothetical protein